MSTGSGPRYIGKYELRELLGRGGMAQVWKAWDTHLERYVAIKLLHTELQRDTLYAQRLFTREARAVASLYHPNIVQIHDFQTTGAVGTQGEEGADAHTMAYMVMDYVEGPTLADFIRNTSRLGKFPPAHEILYLFTAIGNAIDYAHQRGMIHRDIKPANILLDRRNTARTPMGEPILTDFGIVKLLGASTATISGAWLGTPSYISPEQAQGHSGNERSDIYSLGVILYEICTGVRPFSGDTPLAILTQHIHTTPPPPALVNPSISPALSEVILRSLAKDPLVRFRNASDMAEALKQAFNSPLSVSGRLPAFLPDGESLYNPSTNSPSQFNQVLGMSPLNTRIPFADTSRMDAYPPGANLAASTPFQHAEPVDNTPSTPAYIPTSGSGDPPTMQASVESESSSFAKRDQYSPEMTPPSAQLPLTPDRGSITPVSSPVPTPVRTKRKLWRLALPVLLVMLLIAAALVRPYLFSQQQSGSVVAPIVGQVSFGRSEPVNENSNLGTDDTVQGTLKNILPPTSGKLYYAWLLSDSGKDPQTFRLPGPLTVMNGSIHLKYAGDPQHNDLLGTYSRFLITEESNNPVPSTPSSAWRYYAEIPQKPGLNDQSYLDYLRTLLVNDSSLQTDFNIHGGLATHTYTATQAVWHLADSASNDWKNQNFDTTRLDLVSIIDYLDGTEDPYCNDAGHVCAQKFLPHEPVQVNVKVPLFDVQSSQSPSSYLTRINGDMTIASSTPGITRARSTAIMQANYTLFVTVMSWLDSVHQATLQLIKAVEAKNVQSSSPQVQTQLNDLAMNADYAFSGQTDPATGKQLHDGVQQAYTTLQTLGTFDVTPYSQH